MAIDNGNGPTTGEISTEDLLWEPPERSRADLKPKTDRIVFGVAAVLSIAFLVWGVVNKDSLKGISAGALQALMHNGGWVFVLAASVFVVFALWLAFSRYGNIRLGRDDEEPEFRTVSWISMMFGAGMGIGMVFYGVGEPLGHFLTSPPGTEGASTGAAVGHAMSTTLFHWTLHPWAIYAVVGLAIAYGTFRRGRGQLISAAFTPLIGERHANGALGRLIDVFALFATLFGTAASLGLGTLQIAEGLRQIGWIGEPTEPVLLAIIGVLLLCFLASAVSGVAKGIQWLSNTNLVLALAVLVFLLATGATVFVFNLIPTSLGAYFQDFFANAGRTADTAKGAEEWLSGWTIFYWAWWISWSPFVGMFIARISRGRTIREFVGGVILVPSALSLVWFAVMGGNALFLQMNGTDLSAAGDTEAQLFGLLKEFPAFTFVALVVMVLIGIFFITGADSASIIMGTMSQRGAIQPQRPITVFWGLMMGGVAATMMLAGGSDALSGLQTLTIIVAAPFTLILLLLCVALVRDLRRDPMVLRSAKAEEVVTAAVVAGAQDHDGDFQLEISAAEDPSAPEGSGDGAPEGAGRA
ncbi:BCCT family transporter [Nocardiopsis suaedae]|uniref:BCCT family transporter n=1 Tax=Nocardiopsis suaedae TaxID=3018444 RepID=A0ABT4TLP9_9ACTN|nr:BCCT family transporter [Nocardiopsis suaedae]MDA2805622.1 BCCT family transporter [Nocardiopsis suaedae]